MLLDPQWLEAERAKHDAVKRIGKFEPYRNDPIGFFEDVLKLKVWDRQRELILKVQRSPRVACRAGQKVSKTTTAVGLAIWWVATRPGDKTKAVLTAPSKHQVKNILWSELKTLWKHVAADLGVPSLPKDPLTGVTCTSGAQIFGIATKSPEKFQGISGEEVFIIIDEASGFADELYAAARGNTAGGDDDEEDGGAKILALSNPTRTTGWFADAFRGKNTWDLHHISSEDSPNVRAGVRVIRGLATKAYVESQRIDCGGDPAYRTHPDYLVRVLGEFCETDSHQLIQMALIDAAIERWSVEAGQRAQGRLVLGIDPAWWGTDDAIVQPVRGWHAYTPRVLKGESTGTRIAEAALEAVYEFRRLPIDRQVVIVVDGVAAGSSTVDTLRASKAHERGDIIVVSHIGNSSAKDAKRYSNRRTEVWFNVRDWLARGGALPRVPGFREELLAPRYGYEPDTRWALEPKPAVRKRLKRSPNLADALTLATSYYPLPSTPTSTSEARGSRESVDEDEDW